MISPLAVTIPLLKQLKSKARCLVTPLPRRGTNKELIFFFFKANPKSWAKEFKNHNLCIF